MSDRLDDKADDRDELARLAELDGVVADPLKFKRRLRIGEDAYPIFPSLNGVGPLLRHVPPLHFELGLVVNAAGRSLLMR